MPTPPAQTPRRSRAKVIAISTAAAALLIAGGIYGEILYQRHRQAQQVEAASLITAQAAKTKDYVAARSLFMHSGLDPARWTPLPARRRRFVRRTPRSPRRDRTGNPGW